VVDKAVKTCQEPSSRHARLDGISSLPQLDVHLANLAAATPPPARHHAQARQRSVAERNGFNKSPQGSSCCGAKMAT